MTKEIQDKFISTQRLQNYKNFDEYKLNLLLSEKYYILLSIFEISLRNTLNNFLISKFSTEWLHNNVLHKDTKKRIDEAKNKIIQRKESVTNDKIIAELSFGFWTSLFRKSYSNLFRIKDIKQVFPNLPTKNKIIINRNILDKRLNHIRKFRNRIFHYEKILNKIEYKNIETEIYELLKYFDFEIYIFAKEMTKKESPNV